MKSFLVIGLGSLGHHLCYELSKSECEIMLADIDNLSIPFSEFVDILSNSGRERGLAVQVMHEDIFNSMHRI